MELIQSLYRIGGALFDVMAYQIKTPITEAFNAIHDGEIKFVHVKALWRAYQEMKKLPEPTKENTTESNSHLLIELRDEFLSRVKIKSRVKALRVIINLFINVYEFDEPYRQLIDWLISELISKREAWKPIEKDKPDILIWKQDWEKQ